MPGRYSEDRRRARPIQPARSSTKLSGRGGIIALTSRPGINLLLPANPRHLSFNGLAGRLSLRRNPSRRVQNDKEIAYKWSARGRCVQGRLHFPYHAFQLPPSLLPSSLCNGIRTAPKGCVSLYQLPRADGELRLLRHLVLDRFLPGIADFDSQPFQHRPEVVLELDAEGPATG